LKDEQNKEVVEKALECLRDIADEMGPGAFTEVRLKIVFDALYELLTKKAFCQTGETEEMEDEKDSDSDGEESEDMDHDEIILGNSTDLIIAMSSCLGASFQPFLKMLAPVLYPYLGDEHPQSDKTMVIGCLAEVFNNCPDAIPEYFENYM